MTGIFISLGVYRASGDQFTQTVFAHCVLRVAFVAILIFDGYCLGIKYSFTRNKKATILLTDKDASIESVWPLSKFEHKLRHHGGLVHSFPHYKISQRP